MANVKDLLVNGSARVIGTIYGNATSANKVNHSLTFGSKSFNGSSAQTITLADLGGKPIQSAVSSPSASGTEISFIDTISQNANGVITATKKTVRDASASQSGVVNTEAQTFAGIKTFNNKIILRDGNAMGAQIGAAHITTANSSTGEIVLQNGHLRFGGSDWDYDKWAGLKYDYTNKYIYLGLADGSIFAANSTQSGGTFKLVGISTIDASKTASIRNLAVGGGIYWDPYVESASDASDAASITLIKSGAAGGTELRISQLNDANDIINFVTNTSIYLNSKNAFNISDSWLRINETSSFSSGIFTGTSLIRTENQLQVGNSGIHFYADSSGNGYFRNALGIAGVNTNYNLYVNGSARFQTAVNQEVIISGRWMPGVAVTGNQDGNDRPGLRIFGDYPQMVLMSGRVGNVNHGATISLGGFDDPNTVNGSFKTFTIGTPGYNVNFMDIGYGTSTNPHSNGMNSSGGPRIMRFNSNGIVQTYYRLDACNRSNSASYTEAAMQIRERGFGGAQDDTWATAPRLAWHWSGRVQTQIGLGSDNELYLSKNNFANAYKLVYETGTWGINITGNASSSNRLISLGRNNNLLIPSADAGTSGAAGLTPTAGLALYEYYGASSIGAPTNYGNLLTIRGDTPGATQIALPWGGTSNIAPFIRTHSDWSRDHTWSEWKQLCYTDGSGASGTWGISISGNAATATKLATGRTISLTGSVTGSGTFDGSGNLSISTTTNHNHDGNYVKKTGDTMTGDLTVPFIHGQAEGHRLGYRHLDAGSSSDKRLYIGYGAIYPTASIGFYLSPNDLNSRTQWAEINSNGLYANTRFGVNGQNTSYNFYVNGTSHFTSGINIAGTAPISMFGVGSGTYDRSVIYCNNEGIILETPRASNSSDAAILPFTISTRGGQKAPVYMGNLYIGANQKVKITEDGEGGNIDIIDNSSTRHYQIDAYNGNLRLYSQKCSDNSGYLAVTLLDTNGYSYFNRAYGAVWNDYAEYRKSDITEPGRVVIENGDGTLSLSTKRLQRGAEVISDTFGFAIGETDECKTPIAATGRVLAYTYEPIEEYKSKTGWPVCSGPNGTVSIMTEEEEEKYPSRIIGTISEVPDYEEWGTGKVKTNGRVWIRIK